METKYDSFSEANIKKFRTIFEKAVQGIFEETSVKVSLGNVRFSGKSFHGKLTAVIDDVSNPSENPMEIKYREDFLRYAFQYGLKKTDLTTTKNIMGTKYTLIGCAPRSSRYPLIVKNPKGELTKITVSYWNVGV
jgi:hypothetical protein